MVFSLSLRCVMSENMKLWDVAVIGGGIAGSFAATALAQTGRRVLLVEKEPIAHDKVCGEFISVEAQHYLGELGFDLKKRGAAHIANVRLAQGKTTISATLPFRALSLSRRILDDALLLHAQEKGASICRGSMVTALEKKSLFWEVKCNNSDDILAETVFLAAGKHDVRGWGRKVVTQKDFIGFKMHFRLAQSQRNALGSYVEITLFDGGYAGLEPIEDGKANLCLVVTKQQFACYGKTWHNLLQNIMEATPSLADRLAGAEPCWPRPLSIFGIPYGYVYRPSSNAPPNLYRLGDQMAVIPSFSGDGMSIALHTSALAVSHYLKDDALAYHRHAYDDLNPLIRRAAALSRWAESPSIQRMFLFACRIRPKLLADIATHTRIKNIV